MLQSSEFIAALAAALARAQLELTNPEKSLTATLPAVSPREEARTYRYASLATGLDIVRKSLGRQEIAAVQSTVIDQQTGLVRLMTVLAHSSGEWLSSEWPVCPVTETANPQRMGAALTYARRYALFTLVGIAGEDDLDAPEPNVPTASATRGGTIPAPPSPHRETIPANANGSRPSTTRQPEPLLSAEDSQALREALLAELALIQSTDGLSRWAYRRLRSKNILQDGDAHAVENAFQVKIDTAADEPELATPGGKETTAVVNGDTSPLTMATAGPPIDPTVSHVMEGPREIGMPTRLEPIARVHRGKRRRAEEVQLGLGVTAVGSVTEATSTSGGTHPANGAKEQLAPDAAHFPTPPAAPGRTAVDKSMLHLDEPKRVRDKEHLRYVAAHPCLLCSARPSDPHHTRFAQPRALGRKVSDEFAVPLCRRHHDELHDSGNEAAWWHAMGIDPIEIARQLWHETCARRPPDSSS